MIKDSLLPLCRVCGKLRGELSYLCTECLKAQVQELIDSEREQNRDEYRREDAERMEAARNSDGRFYHD